MRHIFLFCLIFCICFGGIYPSISLAQNNTEGVQKSNIEPYKKTSSSKKWRIAYVEGGTFVDYQKLFISTINGMVKLGIIDNVNIPLSIGVHNTKNVWAWLAENAGGEQVEFLKDAFYSGDWDEEKKSIDKKAILARIKEKNDIDIILAFGTAAGIDMATNEHSVPILSMSVTDAVGAGIAKSVEDSGLDHVHAQIDEGRYARQVTVFHDIFKFKRLGIAYEDTPSGRSVIALSAIQKTAEKLGFELVPCILTRQEDKDIAFDALIQCMSTLSQTSEAVYVTINTDMQWDKMTEFLQPLIDNKIPSFAQNGLDEIQYGVLMGVSQSNFNSEGTWC